MPKVRLMGCTAATALLPPRPSFESVVQVVASCRCSDDEFRAFTGMFEPIWSPIKALGFSAK